MVTSCYFIVMVTGNQGYVLFSSSPPPRCHGACQEWDEVLSLLNPPDNDLPDHTPSPDEHTPTPATPCNTIPIPSMGDIESSALVLRGRAHEGLGDLLSAIDCYKRALIRDIYCEEAIDRLCEHHTLTQNEEEELINSMPFKSQATPLEEDMMKSLYVNKFHHSSQAPPTMVTKDLPLLVRNRDVLCERADEHFHSLNMEACYALTFEILGEDPFHRHALILHVACCVQKKKFEELFTLGHRLVNSFPGSALSWYVVGCYYIIIDKHQNARKYLTKCVSLEPNFGHAHIAFGLSFSCEGEHDQAISAFSNAARTMQGSHLPLLYLGKEYHQTGAINISTRFMKTAFDLSPHDPYLLQEIGYVVANIGAYPKAERYFKQAILSLQRVDPHLTLQAWEPVHNNLGHVLRKQGKYDEALAAHMNALQLDPGNASTLTAIAYIYLLKGDVEGVVTHAHRSLRARRDDQFTLEVLHTAVEEMEEWSFTAAAGEDMDTEPEEGEVRGKMILVRSNTTPTN